MGTATKNAAEAFEMSHEIADLKRQLTEVRQDMERIIWALANANCSGAFNHKPFPNIVQLEYTDGGWPVKSDWCLYTGPPKEAPIETYRIRLGSGTIPVLTPAARAIIDVAMNRKST